MTDHTTNEIPHGYCQCGCGQKTRIADVTRRKFGWFKGQPIPFAPNHHAPNPSPEVRFWNAVKRGESNRCWEWQAYCAPSGYGTFHVGGKPVYAHRFSYELHNGSIPPHMFVCHSCDNPACVNPSHLFLGTTQDNTRDMNEKNRGAKPPRLQGEKHHQAKLTENDVKEIRRRLATGEPSPSIAKSYGVTNTAIWAIANGKTWRHIK